MEGSEYNRSAIIADAMRIALTTSARIELLRTTLLRVELGETQARLF
jgi:hypothetical protein